MTSSLPAPKGEVPSGQRRGGWGRRLWVEKGVSRWEGVLQPLPRGLTAAAHLGDSTGDLGGTCGRSLPLSEGEGLAFSSCLSRVEAWGAETVPSGSRPGRTVCVLWWHLGCWLCRAGPEDTQRTCFLGPPW